MGTPGAPGNNHDRPIAPQLEVSDWIQGGPLTLAELRGRVVLLETFQMLCPGCVTYGLPLAQRVHDLATEDLTVIGLHTVFEHHKVMTREALAVFVSEYRLRFPIAIDQPGERGLPLTMEHYGLMGTPSTVLIDRHGRIAASHFGRVDDVALGIQIGRLLAEDIRAATQSARADW